jgi:hypothetical protein
MFRLRNQNNRECAISKGSEFRTSFLLATCNVFSERHFNADFSPRQMNYFENLPTEIYPIVTGLPLARLAYQQH